MVWYTGRLKETGEIFESSEDGGGFPITVEIGAKKVTAKCDGESKGELDSSGTYTFFSCRLGSCALSQVAWMLTTELFSSF